jgi:hypothetical protein
LYRYKNSDKRRRSLLPILCPEPVETKKLKAHADRPLTLPCCQLGLGRQRQQCGLAAANRAAASWRANRLNEQRSTNVEWNVQCRLTGEHFEKIIVGNGHIVRARHFQLNGRFS